MGFSLKLLGLMVLLMLPDNLIAQVVKGSVKAYRSDLTFDQCNGCIVIPIDSTKRDTGSFSCFGIVDADGNFILENVPIKTVFLKISRVDFYSTIIQKIEFDADTIYLKNIPIFEKGCSFYSHAFCTKKYFWGLVKITRGCLGIECHREEPFNLQRTKILLHCSDSIVTSIICTLSDENNSNIEIQFNDIKTCDNFVYKK